MAEVVRDDSTEDETVELTLIILSECYVYQIPPQKNALGHRANDWDVNKWLWTGRLRVVAQGDALRILLEDKTTGELFAACPVAEPGSGPVSVEPAIDSSRYYVLRIDDGKGKHAYIGLGFYDRALSLDFSATMQDHWSAVRRSRQAEQMSEQAAEQEATQTFKDMTLKEGQTFKIDVNLAGGKVKAPKPKATEGKSGGGLKSFALAPPPATAPPSKVTTPPTSSTTPATSTQAAAHATATPSAADDDDEWGEFQ